MAKRSIYQLKQWFQTNDEPTQQQFYDWMESYFHKDEGLIVKSVEDAGGGNFVITFSDDTAITTTVTNSAPRVLTLGNFQVWKKPGNNIYSQLQPGDYVEGWFSETKRIHADYTGGLITDIASFDIIKEFDYA